MDVEEAIEARIETELAAVFGPSVARSLLTMATLSYVTTVGGKTERYHALVDSICTDDRVVEKWDEAATSRLAEEWKGLVASEGDNMVVLTN